MPILTPSYPSKNSSFNVSETTLATLQQEIERAHKLILGGAPGTPAVLDIVLQPVKFFSKFNHYLQITVRGSCYSDLQKWLGWCESKLRHLVIALSRTKQMRAYPYSEQFKCPPPENAVAYFIGLDFSKVCFFVLLFVR